MTTLQQALRKPMDADRVAPAKYIRTLLARTGQFVVSTPVLAAYLGSVIVREQYEHYTEDTVKWTLAMFDVRSMSGNTVSRTIEQLGQAVDDYIEERITTDDLIELKLAMSAVLHALEPVFGKQLRITGWLPGFRVAESRNVLELSGNACPSCTVNPTGYKVNSKSNIAHCLNSEDCGWTSA